MRAQSWTILLQIRKLSITFIFWWVWLNSKINKRNQPFKIKTKKLETKMKKMANKNAKMKKRKRISSPIASLSRQSKTWKACTKEFCHQPYHSRMSFSAERLKKNSKFSTQTLMILHYLDMRSTQSLDSISFRMKRRQTWSWAEIHWVRLIRVNR